MKATELPINNLLQSPNVQFVIPVYQRNYDWTINECKELLNDILSVEENNRGTHFIGSIVLIHDGTYSTNEVTELVIIDGQQRLTTINILYVALYRFAKEINRKQDEDMLYNMFLTNQYVQEDANKLKLKQTDKNSKAFKAILNNTEKQFDEFSNVIENYNYFRDRITKENFNTILNGIKRLIFVEISLERGKDDPQRIFESLNSTGLDLSQSDLIRNFILMDLNPKKQHRIYEAIWNPIEENAKDLRRQKSKVSSFIRDYLTLRNKKIPNKNKVYAEFKNLYSNKKDENFYQELENIKSFSAHYRRLLNPQTEQNKLIRTELEYISRLEINVAYPFLLQVFEDFDNGVINDLTLVKILKLIQNYVWRRFIVGLPTNALNKIFMTLYSEVDTENYYDSIAIALVQKKGSRKFPKDDEIKQFLKDKDLYNIQPKNRNYLFEKLENFNNREFVDTSKEHITIEHIFPQNPVEEWLEHLPSEEFNLFKEKYLNTLGNLTLSGNNGALSNKSFFEKSKMNKNGGEQGYQFSRLWLNTYLNKIDKWNLENFQERYTIIEDRFLKIWKFPNVDIPVEDSNPEYNIFDAPNPTNKKLEYFIFDDNKIYENAFTNMYSYVIGKLYEINAELLLKNSDLIKIDRNEKVFREPKELKNGYYLEANYSNLSKFRTLKKLLRVFGLEDDLNLKYSDEIVQSTDKSRHTRRKLYWKQLLPLIKDTNLFENVNPTKDHWLNSGAGISGIAYSFVVTKSHVRIEISISSSNKSLNKFYFNQLLKHKDVIEHRIGQSLVWEELPDNKLSRIKLALPDVSISNREDWEEINNFFTKFLPRFENGFAPEIEHLKTLKNS